MTAQGPLIKKEVFFFSEEKNNFNPKKAAQFKHALIFIYLTFY
jgi:hypothetical protein